MVIDDQQNPAVTNNVNDFSIFGNDAQKDAEKDMADDEENLVQQDRDGGSEAVNDIDKIREKVGLSGDKPDEVPKELNTASEVDKAEAANQGFDADDTDEEDHEE